ncbi:fatty acid desaturase family protein [Nocardia amikacinitolerans]|uniref:fatty acid desaturase family protein n=1 Tax=Nocardia amikacinitolerans TaxID=756689 RepID=UPI0036772820
MAISDIKAYAHLTQSEIETLCAEMERIRYEITASLGESDAVYIRRAISTQRLLELFGRILLITERNTAVRVAGIVALAASKTIENLQLGHNISHGQWDWMNDPEIHSESWEWDSVGPSSHWRRAHNYLHHYFTNVHGLDPDLGSGVLRMTRDEPWRPVHMLQPAVTLFHAAIFEWAIAFHHLRGYKRLNGTTRWRLNSLPNRELARKATAQVLKDYVLFPLLRGRNFRRVLISNAAANLARNIFMYIGIFCGHFPDGAEKFTEEEFLSETKGEWYLRQLLGTSNFEAGRVLAFLTGGLCYQIEHHLFPDLPSNRYPEISSEVQLLCERYDLPYTTGTLVGQFARSFRTVCKLAFTR